TIKETFAAGSALHFAARRFGQATRLDQLHGIGLQLVLVGNCLTDTASYRCQIGVEVLALYFLDNHKSLFSADINREDRAAVGSQGRVTLFYRQLDILRIMVAATNNDQILEAARNKQFAVFDEAQVAGTQERTFTGRQVSIEGIVRLFWSPPVALCDAGACDPDFANVLIGAACECIGIDDYRILIRIPDTHDGPGVFFVGSSLDNLIMFECFALECADSRIDTLYSGGNYQGRFGKPIAGVEVLTAEATGSKGG